MFSIIKKVVEIDVLKRNDNFKVGIVSMEWDTHKFLFGKYTMARFVKLTDEWMVNSPIKSQIAMHVIQSSRKSSLAFSCSFSSHNCFTNGSFVDLYVLLFFHIFSLFLVKQILCIYDFLWKQGVILCQKYYFAVPQKCYFPPLFLKKVSITKLLLLKLVHFSLCDQFQKSSVGE